MPRIDRRRLLKSGAVLAGASALGFPAISFGQSDKITIGHLTPLTGFLGTLGAYAQLGVKLAAEEINRDGGILGRQINLISEDSINPATAATKAQRMIDQDHAAIIFGEISSASSLNIMQVAERNKKVYFSTGARSDVLRGKDCNRYSFHCDIPNTVQVNAVGTALLQKGMVKGKKFFTLTADYIFGHDLLKAAKGFFAAHDATLIGDELIATDVDDFSPYLLKVRQAKPDVVCCNLAGNQVTNLVKQYAEFGFTYPLVGFNLNTADAWAAGPGNLSGIWPTVWYHTLDVPASKAFVATFIKKYGKPPENHAWIDYITLKIIARAINETKSTDSGTLIAYFEKQTQFDILKGRKGYYRSWDHQLIQQAYSFTVKPKSEMKNEWDMLVLGDPVPAADKPLESIFPTKAENSCQMKA
jgi:branched-chain amino acid transport system substrate-binding protein